MISSTDRRLVVATSAKGRLATGFESIERAGRHLLQIVNGILDLSRLESGYVSPAFQPVELSSLLTQVEQLVEPLARERGIALCFAAPREQATIEADPLMLCQILTNLIGNAIKFSSASSQVEITCAPDQEQDQKQRARWDQAHAAYPR